MASNRAVRRKTCARLLGASRLTGAGPECDVDILVVCWRVSAVLARCSYVCHAGATCPNAGLYKRNSQESRVSIRRGALVPK